MATIVERGEARIALGDVAGCRAETPPARAVDLGPPTLAPAAGDLAPADVAARLRAALWGCSVGIMIGLALSEFWPA